MLSATVWVDDGFTSATPGWGVDHFAAIQAGANEVDSGGTVNILAGTYTENVTVGDVLVNRQVNFVGVPDLDGNLPTLLGSLYLDNDDNALITNIKFQVNPADPESTLTLKNTNVLTISNCVFDGSGPFGTGLNGLRHVSGPNGNSDVTVDHCLFTNGLDVAISSRISNFTVRNSVIENCGSGINQMGGSNLLVENTDIRVVAEDAASNSFGVRVGESAGGPTNNATITGCTISVDTNGYVANPGVYHSAFIVRSNGGGTLTATNSSIPNGVVNLSVTPVDAAGNWWGTTDPAEIAGRIVGAVDSTAWLTDGDADPSTPGFQPDTEPPAAPGVTLVSDTGSSDTDAVTNTGDITLSGVEEEAVVEYSIDGGTTWTASFTAVEGLNTLQVRQTDLAGNVSPATTFSFTRDTVAPTIDATLDKTPADTGWYNLSTGAPTATFIGADAGGSGVASLTSAYTFVEGSHLATTGTVTDVAGNSTTEEFFDVSIDLTAPTLTASINPPSADGWYTKATGRAIVRYSAADATSGVTTPAPYVFSDGVDLSVAAITVTDVAGNTSLPAGQFSGIHQDTGRLTPGIENRNGTLYIVGSRYGDYINVMPRGRSEILVTIVGAGLYRQQRLNTSAVERLIVYGLAGDDLITVPANVMLPAVLFGNDGNDRLLAGGGLTVLVGGNGKDYLQAAYGPAALIGGSGADYLLAGKRGAVLVGGKTDFDNNVAALSAILDEWGRSRTASMLTRSTVHDDQAADYFSGGSSLDYYFANFTGRTKDLIFGNRRGARYQNIV